MENDLQSICGALDTALQNTLDSWQVALSETGDGGGDPQALFCLYPKLVSHLSWAIATLQGAETSQAQIGQRQEMTPAQRMATSAPVMAGCCPCCGGAGASLARDADCSCRDDETGSRETRIVEETIIEETRNGRPKDPRRSGRRS